MSDMKASVAETKAGFHVEGYEKIEYDFTFLDGVFDKANPQLAACFSRWKRCLAIMDLNIFTLYGKKMQEYFGQHGIELRVHKTMIGEKAKSMDTLLSIVDSMNEFGIMRKEAPLVIGGGLVTDVAGFACACYRRTTNYIRVPTTLIGLIDASVSIKTAVNYGNCKNRLGAYHAPIHTFLDFTFLRTLPEAQIRSGFAELIKISSCGHRPTFDLLDKYCEQLISTAFGRADGASEEVRKAADEINRAGIHEMLKLEAPNLHELMLDRVIAYGHTWSPLHELVPDVPLRHGHAISIDMAFSATLANVRGLLSDGEHRRLLNLFSRAGLSMDHPQFDAEILDKGTQAILKTRDGQLRAAVPNPLGSCTFVNDVKDEELLSVLNKHKEITNEYPRRGAGLEAFVDASDTGYTINGPSEQATLMNGNGHADLRDGGDPNGHGGGNGHVNGHVDGNGPGAPNGTKPVVKSVINADTSGVHVNMVHA